MDKDFMIFAKEYLDNKFEKFVETREGKIIFDISTTEKACETVTMLEQELINTNINLLYAYHQWLKNNGKI